MVRSSLSVLARHGCRARAAAQQRHLAEGLAAAQLGKNPGAGTRGDHLHGAVGDEIEGIAGIACVEDDLAGLHGSRAHAIEQWRHFLGRQVAQQVAAREQRKPVAQRAALAVQRVFHETRGITQCRSLLFEEERGDVVDNGAGGEAAGYGGPGGVDVGAPPGELRCAFETKLDRKRGDQRSRGEGQHTRQHLLREGNVKTQHRAKNDRTGGRQAQDGDVEEGTCTCDQTICLTTQVSHGRRRSGIWTS